MSHASEPTSRHSHSEPASCPTPATDTHAAHRHANCAGALPTQTLYSTLHTYLLLALPPGRSLQPNNSPPTRPVRSRESALVARSPRSASQHPATAVVLPALSAASKPGGTRLAAETGATQAEYKTLRFPARRRPSRARTTLHHLSRPNEVDDGVQPSSLPEPCDPQYPKCTVRKLASIDSLYHGR